MKNFIKDVKKKYPKAYLEALKFFFPAKAALKEADFGELIFLNSRVLYDFFDKQQIAIFPIRDAFFTFNYEIIAVGEFHFVLVGENPFPNRTTAEMEAFEKAFEMFEKQLEDSKWEEQLEDSEWKMRMDKNELRKKLKQKLPETKKTRYVLNRSKLSKFIICGIFIMIYFLVILFGCLYTNIDKIALFYGATMSLIAAIGLTIGIYEINRLFD